MTTRGEKSHWAKLTADAVREMRSKFNAMKKRGVSDRQAMLVLASEFNTAPSNVFYIVTGATWKSILNEDENAT